MFRWRGRLVFLYPRFRLRLLRRRWCMRLGHPMASWSPLAFSYKHPDTMNPDGSISPGTEIEQRVYLCERHDRGSA